MGFFDGVHAGHQVLINEAIRQAKELHVESAVLTFNIDPWVVLKRASEEVLITPLNKRLNILEEMGVDTTFVLQFDLKIAALPAQDFINELLLPLNIHGVVCGFDFHYGQKGSGSAYTLSEHLPKDVTVTIIDSVDEQSQKISSTRIHELLANGQIKEANTLLTRPYSITGIVEHGNNKGKTLGFQTANINYDHYVLPRLGVYATKVLIKDKCYIGLCNIGHNPTINYVDKPSLEVHILEYDGDLYHTELTILFYDYIREEKRFDNKAALIQQIQEDEIKIKNIIKEV